jgi:signal transduction histidine kinase
MHLIKFSLSHHKFDERLSIRTEHQLYRVTQELVNNTLKYAKASHVSLDLVKRDGQVILMYEDDGIGFDATSIKKGYGLNNIETRVQSLGGNVEFDAMPGAGSRTIIEIPL